MLPIETSSSFHQLPQHMTDHEQNHWDELASHLGAEPAPVPDNMETQDQDESKSQEPPEFDEVKATASMSTADSADWNDLAASLGVDVPEPAKKAEPLPVTEPQGQELESTAGPEAEPEPGPELPREPGEPEVIESELTEIDFAAKDAGGPPEETEPESKSRRARRSERPSDDGSESQPENFAADITHIESAVEFEPGEQPEEPAAEPAESLSDESSEASPEEGDERRPRRRRRRRSRRGARRTAEGDESESPVAEPESDAEKAEQPVGIDEQRREPRTKESPTKKAGHRNIPTWEEAVGIVVSANMETRAKAAKTTSRSRGRGRGGRGRGRSSGGSKGDKR
jgi:ribonuclease E